MAKEGSYPSRDFVGLRGVLKSHHTNIQSSFRRYLGSPSNSRPTMVQEILLRLQSNLATERTVYGGAPVVVLQPRVLPLIDR